MDLTWLVFPLLQTARLKLRKLMVEDLPDFISSINDPTIAQHIVNIPFPYLEYHAVQRLSYIHQGFESRARVVFAIEEKMIEKVVGEISLHINKNNQAEIGFWLAKNYRNKGYMQEALNSVLFYGFGKLRLLSIYCTIHDDNKASLELVRKNGFKTISTTGNVNYLELINDTKI